MFKKIIIPLDGSSLAECVLPHIAAVIGPDEADVTLLHVLESRPTHGLDNTVNPLDWQLRKSEAEAYLINITKQLKDRGIEAKPVLVEGRAAEQIIAYAEEQKADLILFSSHGQGEASKWRIGSVAQKIIAGSYTSLLLVRAYQPSEANWQAQQYQRILVPLDGSQRVECTLPILANLAQKHAANLLIAHVIVRPEMPRRTPLTLEERTLVDKLIERNRAEMTQYLTHIKSRLAGNVETYITVSENAAATLQTLASPDKTDLVVLSAHGYSGENQYPHGNVVARFINHTHIPLLIIQDLPKENAKSAQTEVPLGHGITNSYEGRMIVYARPAI